MCQILPKQLKLNRTLYYTPDGNSHMTRADALDECLDPEDIRTVRKQKLITTILDEANSHDQDFAATILQYAGLLKEDYTEEDLKKYCIIHSKWSKAPLFVAPVKDILEDIEEELFIVED